MCVWGGEEGGKGAGVYCWLGREGDHCFVLFVQMIVLEQKNKDGSWPRATE